MSQSNAKAEFLQAMQTKRQIEDWVRLPRCANCERYASTGSKCDIFGSVPEDQVFVIHATPCPHYQFDDIPF